MPELILASTSRYRRALLERLGLAFSALSPDCDEDAVKATGLAPLPLAEELARRKAASIAVNHPQAVVIGSDQLACLKDRILGKPGSVAAAERQLAVLSGREHRLITSVAVMRGGEIRQHTDTTVLTMRELDAATIARYVAADDPLDCAGAYKLERLGIALFERIESADHSAITGLPLLALAAILRDFGFQLP